MTTNLNSLYKLIIYCLVTCVGVVFANIDDYDHVEANVELKCIQHCSLQNQTDIDHYDYTCGYNCNVEQCTKGCKLWKDALSFSCQRVCNASSDRIPHKRELYCVIGCNYVSTKYLSEIRTILGTPPAPALLDNSLDATSLKLEWRFPEISKTRLSYHIQWRFEEIRVAWQYCRNASWNVMNNAFFIQGLQPYTKYRFRVALHLGHGHGDPIYSEQSVVIATLADGLPASPPYNVRAVPVDEHSINVNWEPGPFPHGPLLSYVLQITDNNALDGQNARSEVKDVPSSESFYVYRNLPSDGDFTVSVQMRNNIGTGPAATVQVSTPKTKPVTNYQQPVLIFGTQTRIFELKQLYGNVIHLYNSAENSIRGIGIHIYKQLLFILESDGAIWKIPIEENASNRTKILSANQNDFSPLDLSVDWLNDQIYILGELMNQGGYIIKRCNLDGDGLSVALAGLSKRPWSMEIDPCNGYLFWSIKSNVSGGIYRLDISDISNGIKREVKYERILNGSNFGAFVIDYINFRLFVSYQEKNTVYSVSMDGKDISNIRTNVVHPEMSNVISLGMVNQKFYWTDGKSVYIEEYYAPHDTYYHNKFSPLGKDRYKKILINLPNSQPWPVPVNPPINLQAIFGSTTAKIKWNVPHLLGLQGRGAWQKWSYEIAIKNLKTNKLTTYNTNSTSFSVKNLDEYTQYLVKVKAYSRFDKGPWSTEFISTTLKPQENPIILWSGENGLFKSDATVENIEMLIHKSRFEENVVFTSASWYRDQIFMVANNSQVYWYNLTTHKYGILEDMDSVGSISVDWIGKKLYWYSLKQQLIIRSNFNGTQQEPLSILTLAKEIFIDSVKAYLYWSREFVVECAHLNGDNKMEYDHLEPFSGRQVMGLSLDIDRKMVYWVVRGSDGSHLFEAPMAGYNKDIKKRQITSLQRAHMQGPFSYFSQRLIWLQDEKNVVISDLIGQNVAIINGKLFTGLNLVYPIDEYLHLLPENVTDEIVVEPEQIDGDSIKAIGSSELFNITWNPIRNVNYGDVFYEIQIDGFSQNNSTIITNESTIKYWGDITPFTKLNVAIRAFTYWASSSQVRVEIFSPPSTPSVPRNLRTYVSYETKNFQKNDDDRMSIIFRWDPPIYPNGVLNGYNVRCWYEENEVEIHLCQNTEIHPNQTEFIVVNVKGNRQYYFQVQAFTEIGRGTMSDQVQVNSTDETPLPILLVASMNSIFLDDIDTSRRYALITGTSEPIKLTYLLREQKIFWINSMNELIMYEMTSINKTKLIDIQGNPIDLTIDWIERSLYYVESNVDEIEGGEEDDEEVEELDYLNEENRMTTISGSIVYKIDLNRVDKNIIKTTKILSVSGDIRKLHISPFTRKLYWIETNNNQTNKLMYSDNDGQNVEEFFSKLNQKKTPNLDYNSCNCPLNLNIEPIFTIDHSANEIEPSLIFIDSTSKNLMMSDQYACVCKIFVNNTFINHDFPPKIIEADYDTIYSTDSNDILYVLQQKHSKMISKTYNDLNDMLIYGNHKQPYPQYECLSPIQYFHENFETALQSKSFNSLTLKMPPLAFQTSCRNTTIPTPIYIIKYKESLKSNASFVRLMTFDDVYQLVNLKPFTNYDVTIAVTNYFIKEEEIIFGHTVTFQTAPGAPSKPRNISASVLNPTLVQVDWLPPETLNGDVVHYEIHCLNEGSATGLRQKGEQPVNDIKTFKTSDDVLTAHLQKLLPNETYAIWIRAYTTKTNETSSNSDRVLITTYPEPYPFHLINCTSTSLYLTWEMTSAHVKQYKIQYAPLTATNNNWSVANTIQETKNLIGINVRNLKPKNQYKFRLSLMYDNYPKWYDWPSDLRFTFETLGDRPSPPGRPGIQIFTTNLYKVVWETAQDNGAPIEIYNLECLKLRTDREKRSTTNRTAWFYNSPAFELDEFIWENVYNGTDNSWIINGLEDKYNYVFRVSALNTYGWSDPSDESTEFDINEAKKISQKNPMNLVLIATFVPITICVSVVICFIYLTYSRKCGKQKEIEQIATIRRGPDVELATLRELPRRGVHSTNVLYVSATPNSDDISKLPHIRRDQITLTKFLGSGAFGEVFEGKAKGLENEAEEIRVAVKTLRKGASEQEKTEFLQEAQLMSHFKHEHILQLHGVCLDNDPQFIIMELMEAGDLLTYLRNSRNQLNDTPSLNLLELLKMCLDVTKGCRYLEEMHFVHRDLACRNCLVSSLEKDHRIVKIGDFGLARDIYKNDYYRKEGEGLLPVRWMAPESLLDGVFTCQSDVWSFGILLWEIMTLGQQPYQARSNLEVLYYVKRGGRLGKPTDCPEDLYKLMLKCWEFEPDKRPTFKYCLEVLDYAHREQLRQPVTAAHTQYISTVTDLFVGISNAVYFLDVKKNHSAASYKSDDDDSGNNKEKTPFLSNSKQEIPKYLELLYEAEQETTTQSLPIENDGYEIPNHMLPPEQLVQKTL